MIPFTVIRNVLSQEKGTEIIHFPIVAPSAPQAARVANNLKYNLECERGFHRDHIR